MQVARLLRDRLDHLVAGLTAHGKKEAEARKESVGRLTREQAFTVLNRLAALRMAEERASCSNASARASVRGLPALRANRRSPRPRPPATALPLLLFDELAIDLGVLFDRSSPRPCSSPRPGGARRPARSPQRPRTRLPSGPRTRPSAGSTSITTTRKSGKRCARNPPPRATPANWPSATSSSPRATSSSSSPTTPSAASGMK
jgi:hypothetical protein